MGCCGKSKRTLRVQIIPDNVQPRTQRVNIKPSSLQSFIDQQRKKVITNNSSSNSNNEVSTQSVAKRKDSEKCPTCEHPVMTSNVGGRSRKQCTNYSCRRII